MIEQNTNYAYKLKYMDNPTFDKVRDLSVRFYRELPQALQDELFEALNRGVDILDSEPQMTAYLFAFGKMHQAKLNHAFGKLPEELLEQKEINIIDYGCGQALGTMCYADFLRENDHAQKVKTITLIEPSEICLKRAALHASMFFPEAKIKTVNKKFDDLTEDDIVCSDETPTLHILSNVLDMLDFDLDRFAELVNDRLNGNNLFVCSGPYFNYSDKDDRMIDFCRLLGGNAIYSKVFDKYEFKDSRTWTAHFLCFAVGELSEVLSTEVTVEDVENGIEDEYGGVYSRDGKKLLSFLGDSELETYVIKEGTQVICDRAFCEHNYIISKKIFTVPNCNFLHKIIIPASVTSIGENAFYGCENLIIESKSTRFIVTNEGLLIDTQSNSIISYIGKIGKDTYITIITIPASVTSIGNFAFEDCSSLRQIIVPASVTSIGNCAFWGCSSLRQITIPDSVTSIGNNPFYGCENLIIESKSPRFLVTNEGLFIDAQCNNIISYIGIDRFFTIPDSVTSIGNDAFWGCSSLQQITIPSSVTSIGNKAFYACDSLQQIIIPDSVTSIGDGAFGACHFLWQITIPNSVTSIGDKAFDGCSSLQQITIPSSVTNIGNDTFKGCYSLQQIVIPNSVRSIGDDAFDGCSSLQQITIPASVTNIGKSAFSGCSSLRQITIPASVTSIGNNPFYGCENLIIESESTRFIVTNEGLLIDTQCNNIISYFGKDKSVTIPSSVTTIGDYAFYDCDSLQQITIPDSVTSIGESAFSGCSSLQQIIIPASVTCIAKHAFEGCKSLREINIPNSVTIIESSAFRSCESLRQINIPNSVTSIWPFAFAGCKSLQKINIPDSVTCISDHVLCWCESLTYIAVYNPDIYIYPSAFEECNSLQKIILPKCSEKRIRKKLETWVMLDILPKDFLDKFYFE